jgi:putative membrane protein
MRLIKSLLGLLLFVFGLVFGALNKQSVQVDFWFRSVEARLGTALLIVLLIGALLGGLVVTVGVVWPLRRRLHRFGNPGVATDGASPSAESSSP